MAEGSRADGSPPDGGVAEGALGDAGAVPAVDLGIAAPDPGLDRDAARWQPRCACFIVPLDLLRRFAQDPALDDATRRTLRLTYLETLRLRGLREAWRIAAMRDPDRLPATATATTTAPGTERGVSTAAPAAAPAPPAQHLFDCQGRKALPGKPVTRPTGGFKTVRDTTAKVAEFYRSVLGRHSLDNHVLDGRGLDLVSSLHYGVAYDNAFWNGQQMVYGDGDGQLFTAMYGSPDVVAHELTHGVTQFESGLRYEGESGALNESLSDVFGAVFNQWLNQWPVGEPRGWRVGAGILAPATRARGFACLRDLLQPAAAHCLAPQPERYDQIDPTADVHTNSGVPNKAFALYARALGGNAWGTAIQVWYAAATTRRLRTDASFAEFAAATIASAAALGKAGAAARCRAAWATVGVAAAPGGAAPRAPIDTP